LSEEKSSHQKTIDDSLNVLGVSQKSIEDKNLLINENSYKIKMLEEYMRYMRQQHFSASSQNLNDAQLRLFDEAELSPKDDSIEQDDVTQDAAQQRKKKHAFIPDGLPNTDIIHDLPEDEKVCPHDGSALRYYTDECSKQLDYVQAKVTVLNHTNRKYLSLVVMTIGSRLKIPLSRLKNVSLQPTYLHKLPHKNIVMVCLFIAKGLYFRVWAWN
jgi:transposase